MPLEPVGLCLGERSSGQALVELPLKELESLAVRARVVAHRLASVFRCLLEASSVGPGEAITVVGARQLHLKSRDSLEAWGCDAERVARAAGHACEDPALRHVASPTDDPADTLRSCPCPYDVWPFRHLERPTVQHAIGTLRPEVGTRIALKHRMTMPIQPGTFQYILTGPPSRYLAAGDPGATTLRESLTSLGFKQPSLEDAVRAFQLQHNREHPDNPLKIDGKAGIQTLNALYASPSAPSGELHDSVFGRAQFLHAKNDVAAMLAPPPEGSLRLTSADPATIQQQVHAKLGEVKAKAEPEHQMHHAANVTNIDGMPVKADDAPMRPAWNATMHDGILTHPGTINYRQRDVNGRPMRSDDSSTVIK